MRLVPAPRRVDVPVWAAVLAGLWAALVVLLFVMDRVRGQEAPLCLFRRLTGVRCAACGGMHTVGALAQGDVGAAVATNPLVAAAVPLVAVWVGLRLVAGRRVRLSVRERRAWCVALAAAGVLNWVYVAVLG